VATTPKGRRLDADERRAQILACARELFSRRPYAAVSTAEVADAAGVARGLVNHYFGTKRALYLEVVGELANPELPALPDPGSHGSLQEALEAVIDMWLDQAEDNRETWLAAIGAGGFGRDPEIELIIDGAREEVAQWILRAIGVGAPVPGFEELHGIVRAFTGLAEASSVEWLVHGRLSRDQVRALLVSSMLGVLRDVVPGLLGDRTPS
jgi:AcrR family transcriptional regulator